MRINNNIKYLGICALVACAAIGAEHIVIDTAHAATAPPPPAPAPVVYPVTTLPTAGDCRLYQVKANGYNIFVAQSTNNLTCSVSAHPQ